MKLLSNTLGNAFSIVILTMFCCCRSTLPGLETGAGTKLYFNKGRFLLMQQDTIGFYMYRDKYCTGRFEQTDSTITCIPDYSLDKVQVTVEKDTLQPPHGCTYFWLVTSDHQDVLEPRVAIDFYEQNEPASANKYGIEITGNRVHRFVHGLSSPVSAVISDPPGKHVIQRFDSLEAGAFYTFRINLPEAIVSPYGETYMLSELPMMLKRDQGNWVLLPREQSPDSVQAITFSPISRHRFRRRSKWARECFRLSKDFWVRIRED